MSRWDKISPKYRRNRTRYTMGSKKLRERLYHCLECDSMNTRINIYYSRLKCLDCGVISKYEDDIGDRKAIWYDLLKLEDCEVVPNYEDDINDKKAIWYNLLKLEDC